MPPLYVTLLCLTISYSSLHAQASSAATAIGDTLAEGQALAAGDKLVSRNGKFALGFFQLKQRVNGNRTAAGESTTTDVASSPGWYLGIWFNKIPVFTPVWIANREGPITESELKIAQLKISSDGNLVITLNNKTSTKYTVWSLTAINNTNSTGIIAILMGTGNLALVPKNTSSAVPPLWQSFETDYPTDVALPGAKIGRNKKTGLNLFGISKKSLIDPDFGSYSIEVDINGQMRLTGRKPPYVVYWSWTSGKLGELVQVLNGLMDSDPRTKGLLKPTFEENDEEVYFSYTLLEESASVFVLLDVFGQLQLNIWTNTTQSWETVYAQPFDFCITSAVCGPFTVCNDNSGPNYCDCMETFSLKSPRNWQLGDQTGGCARRTPLDCKATNRSSASSGSSDMFHPIAQVTLPYDSQTIKGAAAQRDCVEACLGDCNCTAYSYSNGICSVWHGDLLNVVQDDGNGTISQDVLYLRLAKSDFQNIPSGGPRRQNKLILKVALSASICLILTCLACTMYHWKKIYHVSFQVYNGSNRSKKRYGNESNIEDILKGYDSLIPKRYKYSEVKKITGSFKHILGEGGYGIVYKGKLEDGRNVAVKLLKLRGSKGNGEEFLNEVVSICRTSHINIVNLVGFCLHGSKRALIYDYMVNGSLDKYIYSEETKMAIGWVKLREIAIGIARGLEYLHRGCNARIIHFDIKPHNVLLDEDFCPKIADFGLAKLCHLKDSALSMAEARGTIGFIAPEVFSRGFGVVSTKSDVYSYGMVLLEMIVGRKNIKETTGDSSEAYFPDWIYDRLAKDIQSQEVACESDETARHMTLVALWCIQTSPGDRPSVRRVIEMLEKNISELEMPPKPVLSCPSRPSHFSS